MNSHAPSEKQHSCMIVLNCVLFWRREIRMLPRSVISPIEGLKFELNLEGQNLKINGKEWVDARERQEVSRAQWRVTWLVRVKEELVWLAQDGSCSISQKWNGGDKEEDDKFSFLLVFLWEIFIFWERILNEHLRKGSYPNPLVTPTWLKFWKSRTGNKYA